MHAATRRRRGHRTAASHVIVGATRVRAPGASAGAGGFVGTCAAAGAGAGPRAVSLTRERWHDGGTSVGLDGRIAALGSENN